MTNHDDSRPCGTCGHLAEHHHHDGCLVCDRRGARGVGCTEFVPGEPGADPDAERQAEREFVRRLFGDPAPRDVVRGPGPTREDYLRWNDAVDTVVHGEIPGKVIEDADGVPNAVEPPQKLSSYFGGAVVTTAQLAAVGLTPSDVPKLRVLDPKE